MEITLNLTGLSHCKWLYHAHGSRKYFSAPMYSFSHVGTWSGWRMNNTCTRAGRG